MSTATALGIILTAVLGVTIVVVGVMFWWGAREDGRDQKRVDARLRDDLLERSSDDTPKRG